MNEIQKLKLFRSLLRKKLREECNKTFSTIKIKTIVMRIWERMKKDFPDSENYGIDPEGLAGKATSMANTHHIWFKKELDWLLMDEAERQESKNKITIPPECHPEFLKWANEVPQKAPGLEAKDVIHALSRKANYTLSARHMVRLAHKIKNNEEENSE